MKENTYKKEDAFFSPFAKKSADTKGRKNEEEPCPLRTEFQRDRDRILHSKAFRRLKNKTQVFVAPENDHYRTRMTHTLDVAQIARSITRALDLNEELAEAIALGHDLGHTPFGHAGESVLNKLTGGGFLHNKQSVRVCEVLEREGRGLNLTYEVLDGIVNHCSGMTAETLEGRAVLFADKIAYINHDIDDALRANIITAADLPDAARYLGNSSTKRINTLIMSIVQSSMGKPFLAMERDVEEAMSGTRAYLFEKVYTIHAGNTENIKVERLISYLFNFYLKNPLPEFFQSLTALYPIETVICDFIASMSDTFAIQLFNDLAVPKRFTGFL